MLLTSSDEESNVYAHRLVSYRHINGSLRVLSSVTINTTSDAHSARPCTTPDTAEHTFSGAQVVGVALGSALAGAFLAATVLYLARNRIPCFTGSAARPAYAFHGSGATLLGGSDDFD
jgi:hypothetical protein